MTGMRTDALLKPTCVWRRRTLLCSLMDSHDSHAGPTGKILLMPEDPNAVFIMVATGTGIAPYRAFWRRQFMEDVPNYKWVTPTSAA